MANHPTTQPPDHPTTRELLACATFVLLCTGVPVLTVESYPFSRAPMFADAPTRYADYTVRGSDGKLYGPRDFGLQRNYWGNPLGVGCGFAPPASVDVFGEVASEEEVRRAVLAHLPRFPSLKWVAVEQRVIGPVDERRVGAIEAATRHWRIEREW